MKIKKKLAVKKKPVSKKTKYSPKNLSEIKKAQVSIEMIAILAILIIGAVILAVFLLNVSNKNISQADDIDQRVIGTFEGYLNNLTTEVGEIDPISPTETPLNYNLLLFVNNSSAGSAQSSGSYQAGSFVTVSATSFSGYNFVNWTNTSTSEVVSSSSVYTFTMPSNDLNLTANFSAIPTCTITLSRNPTAGGTVSGAGNFYCNTERTVTATPSTGYTFVSWTNPSTGQVISTSQDHTFILSSNTSLQANFVPSTTLSVVIDSPQSSSTHDLGSSISFNSTVSNLLGSATFVWEYSTGGSWTVFGNSEDFSFAGLNEGTYSIRVTVTDSARSSPNNTATATVTNVVVSIPEYTLTLLRNNNAYGTVSGAGTYPSGTVVTASAVANVGYSFVNWTNLSGTVISTSQDYTFTITENTTLRANFAIQNCTLSLNRNPTAGGNVSGAGTYQCGSYRTVSATTNTGYVFTNWTNSSGTVVSTSQSYSFTLSNNTTLTANYIYNSYNLNLLRNPTAGGTVSGAGTKTYNQSVTVTANPSLGYTFTSWTNSSGTVMSISQSYTFNMPASNLTLTANFTPNTYILTLNRNPTAGGTVSGAGSYSTGQAVNISATPASGYSFVNWTTTSGIVVSTSPNYSFNMYSINLTLVANFVASSYTLTLNTIPSSAGTVSGAGTYQTNQSVTVSTSPQAGYTFVNWTNASGTVVSTSPSYTFNMPASNLSLTANYSTTLYSLNVNKTGTGSGSVVSSPAGINCGTVCSSNYSYGTSVTLTATPLLGHSFTGWSGEGCSGTGTCVVTMDQARNVTANFSYSNFYLTFDTIPVDSGHGCIYKINGLIIAEIGCSSHFSSSYIGSTITVVAIAEEGYIFEKWTDTLGNLESTSVEYSFILTEELFLTGEKILVANFISNPYYDLTLSKNFNSAGVVTGAGSYHSGNNINLSATTNPNYTFINWTNISTGEILSTSPNYTFNMPANNLDIIANYSFSCPLGSITYQNFVYPIVEVGDQCWFAKNLQATKYNDGTDIPTTINNIDIPYVTVYNHENITGLNSEEEVITAYGRLYNWHAANTGKLCPIGFKIPSLDDFYYLIENVPGGALDGGNKLKDCRQVNSPLGGICLTSNHPRWNADSSQYGTDDYGFGALPAGAVTGDLSGISGWIGNISHFWSSTTGNALNQIAWRMGLYSTSSIIDIYRYPSARAFSIRCMMDNT